ncbi:MAG TPA: ATP-dependent metallopeptidase FtsH/Yme1/Tma family protein [Tepidisphaeraceae bacterium]|jgi:ATP-dependent Zn protease
MTTPEPLNYLTPGAVPPPKRLRRGFLGWLIFLGVAALLFVWLKQANPGSPAIPLSDFYQQFNVGNVAVVYVADDAVAGHLAKPVTIGGQIVYQFRAYLPPGTGSNWAFTQFLLEKSSPGTVIAAEPVNNVLNNVILPFIPWLLIFFFIWFFVFRQLRKNNASRQPMPVVVVNPEEAR